MRAAAPNPDGVGCGKRGRCGQRRRAIALLTEAIKQIVDSGAGADMVLPPGVSLTVVDSGAGVDASGVAVTLSVSDTGSGAELIAVLSAMLLNVLDAGSGAEAVTVGVAPLAVMDSGSGVDAPGVAVTLAVSDTAAGSDALLTAILVAVADAAAAVDGVGSIAVQVPVVDVAQAAHVIRAIAATLAVVDLGAGVDVRLRSMRRCALCVWISASPGGRWLLRGWRARWPLAGRRVELSSRWWPSRLRSASRAVMCRLRGIARRQGWYRTRHFIARSG